MSKSADSLNVLQTAWSNTKEQFQAEPSFDRYGFQGVSFDSIDRVFEGWAETVRLLEDKGSWSAVPELAIADPAIAASFSAISTPLRESRSNGLEWLLMSSPFLARIGEAQNLVAGLSTRRIAINRALSKILLEKGEAEVEAVLSAAIAARDILQKQDAVTSGSRAVSELKGQIETQVVASTSAVEEITKLQSIAGVAVSEVDEARKRIRQYQEEFAALKGSAEKREAELEDRVRKLNEAIATAETEARKAKESVVEALRLARDQGLAGSFQSRSTKLNAERRLWTMGFIGAGLILFAAAITLVLDLRELDYETLVVSLLAKAAIAAPAVWVGWYSARQIGRLSKVQEDYEYKAASALAFQAYKAEAQLGGDPAMQGQLLSRAVATFGENPVRLYDTGKPESSSPVEEILVKLKPEKLSDLLATALAKVLEKK